MASFSHELLPQGLPERGRLGRPIFLSRNTGDRLRRPSMFQSASSKPYRRSVFREEGLDDLSYSVHQDGPAIDLRTSGSERAGVRDHTWREEVLEESNLGENITDDGLATGQPWYLKIVKGSRPVDKSSAAAPPRPFSTVPRMALVVFFIAVVVPGFQYTGGEDNTVVTGADAGVVKTPELVDNASMIAGRKDSPTAVCTRWSHQIANVNGTVYIYGGQAKQESGQSSDTWNNNFLTLDLTKTWARDDPALTGLPHPSGPPSVAMGALWHSLNSLFLYGGEFSDDPPQSPLPVSTWEYDINAAKWIEWASPQTSTGNHSEAGGLAVQRSAEGSGISVPELGKSWYFGGHLDLYTTQGWSSQIARVYLKSLLEFTHPGYANTGVEALGSTNAAPTGGVYRNITEGGLQDEAGFTERADGALVYIPGWGDEGIILGLAGGTNETFTEMNTIDIYDVANSTWYRQATSGSSPPIRVNPCVGVVAAPDGTSFQVHLYGGQDLIPFGDQVQYSDMWILTIPSFTWIQVDMDGQSAPYARAGHQCTMWDGQLVVIGGYVGKDISCDSPGIYVFNASSLKWQNSFVALSSSSPDSVVSGSSSSSSGSSDTDDQGSTVLKGSRGYQVPAIVQSIIGGSSQGGATATSPAVGAATAGPIASGKPPTFTVTQSGSVVTQTAQPSSKSSSGIASKEKPSTNVGTVIAGVAASLLAVLAAYLAFCTWLYRKQLNLYKNHVAMAQRTTFSNSLDDANWSSEAVSTDLATAKSSETPAGVALSSFGTEVGGSARGSSTASRLAPGDASSGRGGEGYGGGSVPGVRYGRASQSDDGAEYLAANGSIPYERVGGGHQTAHSSVEDLLGGQEPSFFSVVLNPRQTLRVVNLD
ncbi:cell wall anchored protein [Diplocarpon rosae]|nr:cell wall anchored protein [Diplocarpon rosae]